MPTNRLRPLRTVLYVVMLGLFSSAALAQGTCTDLVTRALEAMDVNCNGVGRNQACYGYDRIEATLTEELDVTNFQQPSDVVELAQLRTLQTVPLNEAADEWGVALMKVQANLPGTLPGQNVHMVVMGDATLENAVDNPFASPMRAFYFTTGVGQPDCVDAPDALVVQTPADAPVSMVINESRIEFASTAILQIVDDGDAFEVTMADGEAVIDGRMMVPEGHWAKVDLDTDNTLPNGFHGVTDALPDCRPTPEEHIERFQAMMDAMPPGVMNYVVDTIEHDERGCTMLEASANDTGY